MKIAIIGAGAIGGYVGATLALSGEDVTFVARGANLAAIRRDGMKVIMADGMEFVARNVSVTDDYDAPGPQDAVILALKAHQVDDVARHVPQLFGPATTVVTMQNGLPYWYFHEHGGELAGTRLASVDPTGEAATHLPASRVIGCVVYPATTLLAPGVVRHIEGDRFPLGELDGSTSERVTRLAAAFTHAGLKAPVLADIRAEIWLKLWGTSRSTRFPPCRARRSSTSASSPRRGSSPRQ